MISGPCGPGAPLGPCGPVSPSGPIGPCIPFRPAPRTQDVLAFISHTFACVKRLQESSALEGRNCTHLAGPADRWAQGALAVLAALDGH